MSDKRILFVEDEESIRVTLELILTKAGYNVLAVDNAEQALNLLQKNNYDLIITDLLLQRKNGTEIIQEAKKKTPDIKIIVLTGFLDSSLIDFAKTQELSGFLQKPFGNDELLQMIADCL